MARKTTWPKRDRRLALAKDVLDSAVVIGAMIKEVTAMEKDDVDDEEHNDLCDDILEHALYLQEKVSDLVSVLTKF